MQISRRAVLLGTVLTLGSPVAAAVPLEGPQYAFDALGELRTVYSADLLAAIVASGTRAIAVTVSDPKVSASEALSALRRDIAGYDAWIARHPRHLLRATSLRDIDSAIESERIAVFYNIKDSTPAGTTPSGVGVLKRLGVTSIQLTYNDTNLAGSGCFVANDPGLTPFGRELIGRIEAERVLLDLSHSGMCTMAEAIAAARRPMIVSHTAAEALRDHRRNTTDANMRAVAEKGGLIGITQIRPFLTDAKPGPLGAYLDHLMHAVNTVGVEHVGIGSDRDHRVVPDTEAEVATLLKEEGAQLSRADWPLYLAEVNGPRRMETIRDALTARGLAQRDLDKIMGTNVRRLYAEVVG